MRYFKIPFCRIFFEKSENIPDQRVYECRMLGQKLGYDKTHIQQRKVAHPKCNCICGLGSKQIKEHGKSKPCPIKI